MHRSRLVPYFLIFLGLYFLVCLTLYFVQERLLFFPFKLPQDYSFRFNTAFEDLTLTAKDGVNLNALHFKTPNPKGAVLFLHGNGGSIDGWGTLYPMYTQNGYDVLFFDYRGYGKSEGKISSQQQLIDDAQLAYDYLKAHFPENRLIISGTSIGTGIATILAGQNQPKQLILNSPYSSLAKLIRQKVKIIPTFIIKYQLDTRTNLQQVNCPVTILHGAADELIPVSHAEELSAAYPDIQFVRLTGYHHNDIAESRVYQTTLNSLLQ